MEIVGPFFKKLTDKRKIELIQNDNVYKNNKYVIFRQLTDGRIKVNKLIRAENIAYSKSPRDFSELIIIKISEEKYRDTILFLKNDTFLIKKSLTIKGIGFNEKEYLGEKKN